MVDIRRIRSNPDEVVKALEEALTPHRQSIGTRWKERQLLVKVEEMRQNKTKLLKKFLSLKEGKDTSELFAQMKELSEKTKELDGEVKYWWRIKKLFVTNPNTPHETVVEGTDDSDNVEIRKWASPMNSLWSKGPLGFRNWLRYSWLWKGCKDYRAFSVFKGWGAKLERAIIQLMLDLHTNEHGYTEIAPHIW